MSNVLITGSNRGIGLELCRRYRERGDSVVAVCRRTAPALEKLGVRVEAGVDVSKPSDIRALAKRLAGERLDILINNAGVMRRFSLGRLDDEEIASAKLQFEVNALGPLLVTAALLRNLGEGSKVAIITSRMGSIADNTSGGHYGYRMSKAAVNAAGKSLAVDLSGKGIAVAILHPGFVRTDMTEGRGQLEVGESAEGLMERIDALTPETTGTFWHAAGEILPW